MSRWIRNTFILLFIAVLFISLACYSILYMSLPQLNGEQKVPGIHHSVSIKRDAHGVPVITGSSRSDVAFATGYLHGQERFFQMDLSRRNSAGELSAMFGRIAFDFDKQQRRHRFRKIATEAIALLPPEQKAILSAYTNGVNAGLEALHTKPFEYWMLGLKPKPWKMQDSLLTVFSMYLELNDSKGKIDETKGLIKTLSSQKILDFISPEKTRWDSPLIADGYQQQPIPNKDEINLRSEPSDFYAKLTGKLIPDGYLGSNNFAVSGKVTTTGHAIIEDDMHLGLRVPTVWYRTQISYPENIKQPNAKQVRVTGVTLPGLPNIVVGSNGHIAWAFTNSYGDWVDLIKLKINGNEYYTNQGRAKLDTWYDTIDIKDEPSVEVKYQTTHWGPTKPSSLTTDTFATAWTAYNPKSTNLNMLELEKANTIKQAIAIANKSGIPPQNFTVGDDKGNIAWTIAGILPERDNVDSSLPIPYQLADKHWENLLAKSEYPKIINPQNNRIWTANARVASGNDLAKLGDGGYALGARQKQIRNALLNIKQFNEKDLLDVALDDRALYMNNWRKIILATLKQANLKSHPERGAFLSYVQNWSGRAEPNDVGYRLVREFHDTLNMTVIKSIGRYLLKHSDSQVKDIPDSWIQGANHEREMLLRLYQDKPINWLSPQYKNWDQLFLKSIDKVITQLSKQYNVKPVEALKLATWGSRNTAEINHPLSRALPIIGSWLDMPHIPLSGDSYMPKAQRPTAGVSERMIVSPGNEQSGIFHMSGGQSGNPISPFYKDGFNNWANGTDSPFLPGPEEYHLILLPKH
ncbi:penicillin acylase family protein [Shewanella sp. 202IG2-18]|uniref:penicillin acylase family protein n=1 Tax=Parashewanella hymeniacidonis TaxID=2807618 RepID=UPI0019604A0F|nr:penicillin acylase family protein [Parashewanella hymeniacidonis]MBM7072970.1 penicillin acylase family protein [Parashewanella hymeniacidonis]